MLAVALAAHLNNNGFSLLNLNVSHWPNFSRREIGPICVSPHRDNNLVIFDPAICHAGSS